MFSSAIVVHQHAWNPVIRQPYSVYQQSKQDMRLLRSRDRWCEETLAGVKVLQIPADEHSEDAESIAENGISGTGAEVVLGSGCRGAVYRKR